MALWRSVHARRVTKRVGARCCGKGKPLDIYPGGRCRSVLVGGRQGMLEAFHGHVVEEAGVDDLGAESFLLE